jgi:hypothetical protein
MASELDRVLPAYDFVECHKRTIQAPPAAVYRAIWDVTLREIPVAAALFAIRSVPERLLRRAPLPAERNRPLVDQFFEAGFTLLADIPEVELVAGLVTRIGRVGELVPLAGPPDFHTVQATGLVKVAMNFTIATNAAGTVLRTETRVHAVDAGSRRAFRRYWFVVRPFSGLIRREWLRAIARRAERAAESTPAAL